MIVCHCKAVSDRTVREVVRSGASTRAHVRRACGAGGVCGGCRPVIQEILDDEREPAASQDLPLFDLDLAPAR